MINVKTDKDLKEKAQQVAEEMGLSLSAVINNYLKGFVIEKTITFRSSLTPNNATAKSLDSALNDVRSGKNLVGPFSSADDFMSSLLS